MQAQQNACAAQTLSNKCRIMLNEIQASVVQNKTDIINAVYTKSGCTLSIDGSRVCSSFPGGFLQPAFWSLPLGDLCSSFAFFVPPQENFRKGIYGMLHLAEIGGPSLVKAIESLEANTSGALKKTSRKT